MSRALRVDASDPRIAWSGWIWDPTVNNTLVCTPSSPTVCQFFFLFRGTGIKIFGKTSLKTRGAFHLVLDGNIIKDVKLNGTTFSDEVSPIYRAENMTDGDHELMGNVPSLASGDFSMDHFEIENSSGDGFDLLGAGPTAQDVPPQAVTVDNTDPTIKYHDESIWLQYSYSYSGDVCDYGRSLSYSETPGASLSFSFDGVAIWHYGRLCRECAGFKVSIDGSTPQRLNANNLRAVGEGLNQRIIWSNTTLDPGRHNVTLTHDDITLTRFNLDFFRFLPGAGASTQLSSFSTTGLGELPTTVPPVPPTNQSQTNRVPLAVGLTLGLLVLGVVVLCGVRRIYLRRGRRPIDAHSVSPFTGPSIRLTDQQPSIPQVRKGVPQPARPSGIPMVTVDPAVSSGVTGLGPPPSYETPPHDWRVDTAQ